MRVVVLYLLTNIEKQNNIYNAQATFSTKTNNSNQVRMKKDISRAKIKTAA